MGAPARCTKGFPVLLLLLAMLLLLLPGGAYSSGPLPPFPPTTWSGPHMADLNVLLPPRMTNPVQYRLLGSGGCFTWSWDHHDILSVKPEYNGTSGCSISARLTSVASYAGRKETAVYATDIQSGAVIRCEVFIDKIARIQIFHHSVKLDLGGLTTLHIRAFDDNENVFSSLVGLRFNWSLMPRSIDSDSMLHHLVHVPLKETPLSDCGGFCGDLETGIQLEDSGVGSDLYVVKGIEIGHEIVTTHLVEPHVEHLMDKIVLTVAELMSLDPPSPVFVIIGSSIQYRLIIIRQNTPKAIDLPSLHHRWSTSNSTVAKVDAMMGIVITFSVGITSVVVEDSRVAGHKQTSVIHVVIPDRLALYITPVTFAFDPLEGPRNYPLYTWYVVVGQQYVVHMKVFSPKPEEQEIYLTEGNEFKLESDILMHWYISSVPTDIAAKYGWRNPRSLKPQSVGHGILAASLTYHRGEPNITEVLNIEQEVIVCNKVTIDSGVKDRSSEVIRLPWAPGLHQELELTATGGCAHTSKDYNWFSSNQAIVSVTAVGVLCAKHPGLAIITLVSVFDFTNSAEVVVEVSIPSSMVMLPYFPVEAIVGTYLQAAVTLNTPDGNYYDKCDAFSSSIRWNVHSGRECFGVANTTDLWAFDMPSHVKGSDSLHCSLCAWTYLYTSCHAQATLHATFDNFLDGQHILQASKRIAAYCPLFAKQAGDGNQFGGYSVDLIKSPQIEVQGSQFGKLEELYLVPGTTMDVLLLGGPEQWEEGVEFIDIISIYSEENQYFTENFVVNNESRNGGRLYTVLCQTVGSYRMIFSRGNLVGNGHPLQAVENFEMSLLCSFPSLITLIANEHASTLDIIQSSIQDVRGSGNIRLSSISVANGHTLRMSSVSIHSSGRAFANSSSICLRWELTNCQGLAHWDEKANSDRSLSTWERFLSLHNASGQCIVRATLIGLNQNLAGHIISERALLIFDSMVNGLTDALKLQLVSSLVIIPEFVLLVSNPEAKVNLSVTGGTCSLEAIVNDTRVVEILHHPGSAPCSWLSLGSRGPGTALLTIYDKGLCPPSAAMAMVKVSEVEWIKLISEEEIFMLEGTTKPFDILAGIDDGISFDSSQYAYMNIHVHFEGNIIKLVNEDGSLQSGSGSISQPNFFVKAANLGLSSIYVSIVGQSGSRIISQHVMVEVYPELRLYPHYVFVSPGASYMVTAEGGPTVGVILEYTSLDACIAIIDSSSGQLSANSIGNGTVRVSSYVNGVLICEAYGRVEVGVPPVMFLNMQSEHLCVGCEMPVFPSFPEGNLFSFYEVCRDYKWSIENAKVLGFHSSRSSYSDGIAPQALDARQKSISYDAKDDDYGFINLVYGRSAGRSKISVSFSCNFISSGGQISRSYNASHILRVISEPPLALGVPITWVLPPFYTTSDVLPQLSDLNEQADSRQHKRSVTYSLLKSCEKNNFTPDDAIVLSGPKIKTRKSNSLDCLQAKEPGGRLVIACCVRVAEVAQVRVIPKESMSHVVHLAVNAILEIVISYSDDLGYPFFEAHGMVPLDVETNYHDVVSLHMPSESESRNYSKGIAHLEARKEGKALLKIFIKKDPRKAAYVLVSVGPQLIPRNPVLQVGNLLNFSMVCDGTSSPRVGQWSSANQSVLSVNKVTGEAHARAEGNSQVFFESSSLKLQTTVTVLKNEQILVHALAETLTNVPFPSEGYKFLVDFSDSLTYKIKASEATYDCRVDPSYIGYAKPWFDHVSGASYCLFFPYTPKHLVNFASKLNTTRIGHLDGGGKGRVYVSITASLKDAQDIRGSAHSLFIGGFSVSEVDKLNFSPISNKTWVTITGNTDVQIQWNCKDLLIVRPLFRDDFGIGEYVEYEIMALKARKFTDRISIVLPDTGQKVEFDVNYDPGDQSALSPTRTVIWFAVLMCLLVLLLTVVIFVRLLDRPDTYVPPRQQVPPPLPAHSAPATPLQASVRSSQSPDSTPQPFIEYVRRTINETPYYKRDGRRFNPQYTY